MTTTNNPLNLILARIDNIENILLDIHYNTGGKLPQKPAKVSSEQKKVQQAQVGRKSTKNSF
jgi:hypothetical protein